MDVAGRKVARRETAVRRIEAVQAGVFRAYPDAAVGSVEEFADILALERVDAGDGVELAELGGILCP